MSMASRRILAAWLLAALACRAVPVSAAGAASTVKRPAVTSSAGKTSAAPMTASEAPTLTHPPTSAVEAPHASAQTSVPIANSPGAAASVGSDAYPIDLPGALRLAGARNLDVQIARERLAAASALSRETLERMLPSVSAGIAYRRHTNAIQDVQGDVINVDKESYAPGATVVLETDIGEAVFRRLEARQHERAAGHEVDVRRDAAVVAAASGYFDLVHGRAAVRAAEEALSISSDYAREVEAAVRAGLALEADQIQARSKRDEDTIALRTAEERQRVASVRLAAVLDLDAGVHLAPHDEEPVALEFVSAGISPDEQVTAALAARPEIKQRVAELDAAMLAERGAKYGPLAPTISGQIFAGGLGGGKDGGPSHFEDSEDYLVGLSWKLGPGGLLDMGRIEGSQARTREAVLDLARTRRTIAEEVLAAREKVDSLGAQVEVARRLLSDTREVMRQRQQRGEFGVAVVLEAIQAERDWTRALDAYLATVTDYDKAQYELMRATGSLAGAS